ncbi:MAG: phosphodiester glycosidase family protein [Bdellovibrionota bacterium]
MSRSQLPFQQKFLPLGVLLLVIICGLGFTTHAQGGSGFEWRAIEHGFWFGKYELGSPSAVIRSEVYLFKFDPRSFNVVAALATEPAGPDLPPGSDLRTFVRQVGGVAGINANFFDEKGQPLGLLILDSQTRHKLQRGGRVLTGVFSVRNGHFSIEHRDHFKPEGVSLAIQAGPRLIDSGSAVQINADETSRRSGIALTKQNEIILYATVLRFPGASLKDIQQMLLDPALGVVDALNLDGGGSSQLFVESFADLQGETFITGGDPVPVGLVVKRKGS